MNKQGASEMYDVKHEILNMLVNSLFSLKSASDAGIIILQ